MRGVGGKYGDYFTFYNNTVSDLSEGVYLKNVSNCSITENDFDDIGLVSGHALYTAQTDASYLTGYCGFKAACHDAVICA